MSELKEAYRRLAQLYHPDGKLGDLEKFIEIKQCYDHIIQNDFPKQKPQQPQQK